MKLTKTDKKLLKKLKLTPRDLDTVRMNRICDYSLDEPAMKKKRIATKNIDVSKSVPFSDLAKVDLKDYSSKMPLSRIQWKAIASDQGVMGIYKFAQKKYGNILSWRNRSEGSVQKYLDAMIRHLFAILSGEDIDPESGLHHGAAMAWNALTYLEFVIEDMETKENVTK